MARVRFVYLHNAGRSQMSQAFFARMGEKLGYRIGGTNQAILAIV